MDQGNINVEMSSNKIKQQLNEIKQIVFDFNIPIQDKRIIIGNEKNYQFIIKINEFLTDSNMATQENIKFLDELILYCGFPIPFFCLNHLIEFYQNCQFNGISEQLFINILANLRLIYSCYEYNTLDPMPPELEIIIQIENDVQIQKDFKGFREVEFKPKVFQFDYRMFELKTFLFQINQMVENQKNNIDLILKAQNLECCHQYLIGLQTFWENQLIQQQYHIDKEIIKIMLSQEIKAAIQNIKSDEKLNRQIIQKIKNPAVLTLENSGQQKKDQKKNIKVRGKYQRNDKDDQIVFNFSKFIQGEIVDFEEDQYVQFKDYNWPFKHNPDLVKSICKEICAFMNAFGGLLIFGIDDSGCVKGFHLTQKQKDQFSIFICHLCSLFIPKIKGNQIECLYYPVRDSNDTGWAFQSWIAVIKINPCRNEIEKPNSLYVFTISDYGGSESSVYSYERIMNNCTPTKAQGIIAEIIQRSQSKTDHSNYKFKIILEKPNEEGVDEIDSSSNSPMINEYKEPKIQNYNNKNGSETIPINLKDENYKSLSSPLQESKKAINSKDLFIDNQQPSTYLLNIQVQGLDWVKISGFIQIKDDENQLEQIAQLLFKQGFSTMHSGLETLAICQKDVYFLLEEKKRNELLDSFEGGKSGIQFQFLFYNGVLQIPQIQHTAIVRNFNKLLSLDLMQQLNILENCSQYEGNYILVWFQDQLKFDQFLEEFQSKDLSKFINNMGSVVCHSLSNQLKFDLSDEKEAVDFVNWIESNCSYYNFIPKSLGNSGQKINIAFYNSPDMFSFYNLISSRFKMDKVEFLE